MLPCIFGNVTSIDASQMYLKDILCVCALVLLSEGCHNYQVLQALQNNT